jgi:hypothetical protein
MLLAKIQGGEVTRYPYSLALLRADNLNVSLSDAPSAKTLARLNAVQVTRTPMPLADHTKTVTEGKPVFRDGAWHQVWIVTDASQAEVESIMNMRREAIRQERDARLERGFIYDFGLGRGPHLIGTTPSDMRGWDEVTKLGAGGAKHRTAGDGDHDQDRHRHGSDHGSGVAGRPARCGCVQTANLRCGLRSPRYAGTARGLRR